MFALLFCIIGQFQVSVGDIPRSPEFVVSVGDITVSSLSAKPIVRMYSKKSCGPCNAAKLAISSQKSLQFELKEIELGRDSQTEVPKFEWDSPNGKMQFTGWYGIDHLRSEYKRTQVKFRQTQTSPLQGNYQNIGVRGATMEHHVRVDHGIDTRGLTPQEIQQAHNAVHAGVSASVINAYIKNRR